MFLVLFILCLGPTLACPAQTAKDDGTRTIPKAERKAAEKARKAAEKQQQQIQDSIDYQKVEEAFQTDRWAFETFGATDQDGLPVPSHPDPNIVGFNGKMMDAVMISKTETNLGGNAQTRYDRRLLRGEVTKQRQGKDKKGNIEYIYDVQLPFEATVTALITPGSCKGYVNINQRGQITLYCGKFMPIEKCWYYIKTDK